MTRPRVIDNTRPIDVTGLESGLRDWWNETLRSSEKPVHRTMTLNLIAVGSSVDAPALSEEVDRVLRRRPGHAYLILLERDSSLGLRATLGTRLQDGDTRRHLLARQITLIAGNADLRKLPNLIRPLLSDDVPTILYWSSAPQPALFTELSRLATEVVFDSSRLEDPIRDSRGFFAQPARTVDLTWIRLKPWRRALALAFEHLEWQPGEPTQASIHRGGSPGAVAAADLLGRWLAERLGVRPRIVPVERDAPELEPVSLEVSFDGASIEVRHDWPDSHLRAIVSLPTHCILPFTCATSSATRGDLLVAATDLA